MRFVRSYLLHPVLVFQALQCKCGGKYILARLLKPTNILAEKDMLAKRFVESKRKALLWQFQNQNNLFCPRPTFFGKKAGKNWLDGVSWSTAWASISCITRL